MNKLLLAIGCLLSSCLVYADNLIDLGIDPSRAFSSITEEEARGACVAAQSAKLTLSDNAQCTLMGLGQANQTACEQARDACLAEGPEPIPDPVVRCDDASTAALANCDAMVGMAQDCLNERLTATSELMEGLSCANIGSFPTPPVPKSCSDLNEICPGLFE